MTCIVGLIHNGNVYMGADSYVVEAGDKSTRVVQPKIFLKNGLIMGVSGLLVEMENVWKNFVLPPRQKEDGNDYIYKVADALKAQTKEHYPQGISTTRNSELLLGCDLGLFHICLHSYVVTQPWENFSAIGSECSSHYALGSLWSTQEEDPLHRIEKALSVAEAYSRQVRHPFTIMKAYGDEEAGIEVECLVT